MDTTDIVAWRPQPFGTGSAKGIRDALVEPLWTGYRALAFTVTDEPARILDPDGADLADVYPTVAAAVAVAGAAERLVLDGYLTDQATRSPIGAGRTKVDERVRRTVDPALALAAGAVAFVAVDLLLVDDDLMLDVPLLERKRILESILVESDLVRTTPFVREPLGSFLASWRAQGFGALAYKSANSRYTPGVANPGWATAAIPRR
ncbi:MAG: hypothetical protein MUC54_04750 [Chloroflexi bacterium]|nr:hypothetical protein [Chloroflexota bacterium]